MGKYIKVLLILLNIILTKFQPLIIDNYHWSIYLFLKLTTFIAFWLAWSLGKLIFKYNHLSLTKMLIAIQYYTFKVIDFNNISWQLWLLYFYHSVKINYLIIKIKSHANKVIYQKQPDYALHLCFAQITTFLGAFKIFLFRYPRKNQNNVRLNKKYAIGVINESFLFFCPYRTLSTMIILTIVKLKCLIAIVSFIKPLRLIDHTISVVHKKTINANYSKREIFQNIARRWNHSYHPKLGYLMKNLTKLIIYPTPYLKDYLIPLIKCNLKFIPSRATDRGENNFSEKALR